MPTWLTLLVVFLAPSVLLCAYGVLSLLLFHYSTDFRDWVSPFPDQFDWLTDIFPILLNVPATLAAKSSIFSTGYIHHLYLAALAVFAANLAVHVLGFLVIRNAMLAGFGRDTRYRKRFNNPDDAMLKVALGIGFFAVIFIAYHNVWLWPPTGRRPLYVWDRIRFATVELPMFLGALPSLILCGIQVLFVCLTPKARKLPWGADAIREESAISSRNRAPL